MQAVQQSLLLDNFSSIIPIRCSDINLLALSKLKNKKFDYMIRYFRVKPEKFLSVIDHLEKNKQIHHTNVEQILKIHSDIKTCEVCILYEPSYSLVERADIQNKLLSAVELSAFLNEISAGLRAQQAHLLAENLFLDEWSIFISQGKFKTGVSLPFSSSEILDDISDALNSVYHEKLEITRCTCDYNIENIQFKFNSKQSFYFGATILKAIGYGAEFHQILKQSKRISSGMFENTIQKLLAECEEKYSKHILGILSSLLKGSNLDEVNLLPNGPSNLTTFKPTPQIHTFHSFFNGGASEGSPKIEGHHNPVSTIALSRNNKWLISGSNDCSVKLYNFEKKELVHSFKNAHKDEVLIVAISDDGEIFASGSIDRSIKVYNLEKKTVLLHNKNYHQNFINSMQFTKDKRYLITGSSDSHIKVLDLFHPATRQPLTIQNPQTEEITGLVLLNNDRTVISASYDYCLRAHDIVTGKYKRKFNFLEGILLGIALSANQKTLAINSSNWSIKILCALTFRLLRCFTLDVHNEPIASIALTSEGKFLISGSMDNNISIFNVYTGRLVRLLQKVHSDGISMVKISSGEKKEIISSSFDCSIKVFDFETLKLTKIFEINPNFSVKSVVFTPDNKYLLTGAADNKIRIFNMETKRLETTLSGGHSDWILSLAVSSDSKYLVSGSSDNQIIKWSLKSFQKAGQIQNAHQEWMLCCVISPNDKYIVSAGIDRSVKIYDFKNLELLHTLQETHDASIRDLDISKDSQFLASGSQDGVIQVYDLISNTVVLRELAHKDGIRSVKITHDNRFIVSGAKDGTINVYNIKKKILHHEFENAHDHWIKGLVLSPDSRYIISGGGDYTIRIFDLQTLKMVENYRFAHTDWIDCLAISSEGTFIVSGSQDFFAKVHRVIRFS